MIVLDKHYKKYELIKKVKVVTAAILQRKNLNNHTNIFTPISNSTFNIFFINDEHIKLLKINRITVLSNRPNSLFS